jgi:hypothetical protein
MSRRSALLTLLVLAASGPSASAERGWQLLLEPSYTDAFGHDQHVLTVHEVNTAATPSLVTKTPVTLDTEAGPGYRLELQYSAERWTYGLDFFWFDASQGRTTRTATAGGPNTSVIFESGDRRVVADAPGETLSFAVLEDTDIAAWTADLYATTRLTDSDRGRLSLQVGVRNADFDNDFHCFIALDGVGGSRLDASSNYSRMIGPLAGIAADVPLGPGTLAAYLGQSVVFGEAEPSHLTSDFTGSASAQPLGVVAQESFGKFQDVAIPITEFRLRWLYPFSERVSFGLAANTSVWWDVPVPPGVIPLSDGDELFHENTIVYFGLGVSLLLKL